MRIVAALKRAGNEDYFERGGDCNHSGSMPEAADQHMSENTYMPEHVGVVDLETLASMSGLDFLHGMLSGELPGPPISKTLGFTLVEVEEGRAVFVSEPGVQHYNPIRTVHAGYTATLLELVHGLRRALDAAEGHCLHDDGVQGFAVAPDDEGYRSRPRRRTLLSRGRRGATAEGRLSDAKGKLLAHATTTCLIFDF